MPAAESQLIMPHQFQSVVYSTSFYVTAASCFNVMGGHCWHMRSQAAALKLSYSEYGDLSVEERVLVLSAMSHLALSSEAVRDHFAAAVEPAVAVAPRPSAKKQVNLCIFYQRLID